MNLASRLLKEQVLTPEQLAPALYRQKKYRGFLGRHLLDLRLVLPEVLAGFISPHPPEPQSLEETGLPAGFLAQLALKHYFYRDSMSTRELSRDLKLPEPLTERLVEHLKEQKFLHIKPRDAVLQQAHLAMQMRYTLSDLGKNHAEQCLEANRYVGPAPVPLEDYWDWVEYQTIQQVKVKKSRLKEVFGDYVVSEALLDKIGPAINSGRSIFLFGPSGNGKTITANCIGAAFEDPVFVPYALYVYGQVIRLFDEVNHQLAPFGADGPKYDARWLRCRRPVVVAGGEMTEDALELNFNPILKFYEAPHQLRANNGIFIIDDFGRQKISPRQLLNRWMYPLETRQDFCCLHTGQQFAVPFDQLIIFSTNLNPYSLADEAFLRRIRHKIYLGYVSPDQYLEIFRRACARHGIAFDPEVIRDMMARYYVITSRPLCACHPRDLVENLVDRARFMDQAPHLSSSELDYVCQTYFVKPMGITDYDAVEGHKATA
jgi:hypothetical protein